MPKTDAFFIRAQVAASAADQYFEAEIPLGSFVDVMANSVLRILNIEGEWACGPNSTGNEVGAPPTMASNQAGDATWQLCTQTQAALVGLNNKQVIGKGQLWARNPDGSVNSPTQVHTDSHLPQHYSEGYLVATESIYLGALRSDDWELADDMVFNIVLECQVEKLDAKKGMALALSQQ